MKAFWTLSTLLAATWMAQPSAADPGWDDGLARPGASDRFAHEVYLPPVRSEDPRPIETPVAEAVASTGALLILWILGCLVGPTRPSHPSPP